MQRLILCILAIFLFGCSDSNDNRGPKTVTEENTAGELTSPDVRATSPDLKELFRLLPLSVFDATTEGISAAEKEQLLDNGASAAWKMTETSKTRLSLQSKSPGSDVTIQFFKNTKSSDGKLVATVNNGRNSELISWDYSDQDKSLKKLDAFPKIIASDFFDIANQLPDSYEPTFQYQLVRDEAVEVSLQTFMDPAFEEVEITNQVLLIWNGQSFEKKISVKEPSHGSDGFQILDKVSHAPGQLPYEGKVVDKKFWRDANGENVALFTQTKEALFVYHYAIKAGKEKLLRKIYDFEKDCEYDLLVAFDKSATEVSDLDGNNYGELTFAYELACRSDVSPTTMKLLVLENGEKYILRGQRSVFTGNAVVGGEKTVDPSFDTAPEVFLTHANQVWERLNEIATE